MARIHREGPLGLCGAVLRSAAALCCILALAGCAGGGAALRNGGPEAGARILSAAELPAGASAYLLADAAALRPILEKSTALREAVSPDVLSRTSELSAAFFVDGKGPERRFYLVAAGRYPAFRAGISLTLDRDWKRKRSPSGLSYWRSERRGLSLVLTSTRAIVSDGVPESPGAGPSVPDSIVELGAGAALSLWLDAPERVFAPLLGEAASLLRLPADRLVLALRTQGALYSGTVRLETPTASHARALAALLNLVRPAIAASDTSAGIPAPLRTLLSRSPVLRGSALEYADLPLEPADLALLLDALSVYSKP